jgi:hypothetical protein
MKDMFHHIFDLNLMIREEEAARQIRIVLKKNPKNSQQALEDIMKAIHKESMDRDYIRQSFKECEERRNKSNKDQMSIAKIVSQVEKKTCIDMF